VLLSRPVAFDPGAHKVVATAPGLAFSQELSIAEREEKRIDVVFTRAPAYSNPAPFRASPLPSSSTVAAPIGDAGARSGGFFRSPTVGWVAVGVGGASLVGASISFLVRRDALNDIETECPTHQNCPRHLESAQSKARTFGALSVALGVF